MDSWTVIATRNFACLSADIQKVKPSVTGPVAQHKEGGPGETTLLIFQQLGTVIQGQL